MARQTYAADEGKKLIIKYLRDVIDRSAAEMRFRTADEPGVMPHRHKYYEMMFHPEDPSEPLSLPELIVVTPPGVEHPAISRNGCVICFQLDSRQMNCSYCQRGFGDCFDAQSGDPGRLLGIFDALRIYEDVADPVFRRVRRDMVLCAMIELLEHLPENLQSQPHYVNSALWYIENNFHRPDLRISDVAGHAALSAHQMNRRLHGELGQTIGQLIVERRLAEARKLLETTSFTTGEIASMCGFRERAYFSAMFKRRFGIPPSEARALR